MNGNKILILAPHTDDGELGCGGTIARMLADGKDVYYVAFSTCKESVPQGLPDNILEKELLVATNTLGIKREKVIILDYPVRNFAAKRQEILDDMIKLDREINPDIIFAPSIHDIHQDHHTIAEEAMRAFKKKTLFAYEVPWNNFTFNNQIYITLSEEQVEKKAEAIACYESQHNRAYAAKEFTFGQARLHGVQVGYEYAEVFEAVREIV